jgi:hypothetical protein
MSGFPPVLFGAFNCTTISFAKTDKLKTANKNEAIYKRFISYPLKRDEDGILSKFFIGDL